MNDTKLGIIDLGDGDITLYVKQGSVVKLEHNDVTYYKDAAIKFLKDRGTTFEELTNEGNT